jgi:hypothetical protein
MLVTHLGIDGLMMVVILTTKLSRVTSFGTNFCVDLRANSKSIRSSSSHKQFVEWMTIVNFVPSDRVIGPLGGPPSQGGSNVRIS